MMPVRKQMPLDLGVGEAPDAGQRWEFLHEELYKVMVDVIRRADSLHPETLAQSLIIAIADHLGGQEVYLPRGDRIRFAARNRQILDELESGSPMWKVAHKHALSVERIRQIMHRQEGKKP